MPKYSRGHWVRLEHGHIMAQNGTYFNIPIFNVDSSRKDPGVRILQHLHKDGSTMQAIILKSSVKTGHGTTYWLDALD